MKEQDRFRNECAEAWCNGWREEERRQEERREHEEHERQLEERRRQEQAEYERRCAEQEWEQQRAQEATYEEFVNSSYADYAAKYYDEWVDAEIEADLHDSLWYMAI